MGWLVLPAIAREPWDLSYLLDLDPNQVTLGELGKHAEYLEDHYQKYNQVEGIIWQGNRSSAELEFPDRYGSGGDSSIFGGHYLAAATYRFLVTHTEEDLNKVLAALRGLHILTHISGMPGVISRCAFPASQPEKWNYPASWQGRIENGFVYESPENIKDVLDETKFYPKMIFYTRATRDQLTGLLYGLSIVWGEADPTLFKHDRILYDKILIARKVVKIITESLWWQLRQNDFKIRDQTGRNDTNSDGVDWVLKLQLLALYKEVLRNDPNQKRFERIYNKYVDLFENLFLFGAPASDWFNVFNNLYQYYAWNLRWARAHSIYVLEDTKERQKIMRAYARNNLWDYVEDHKNTHFTFLFNAMKARGSERLEEAVWNLKSLSLRPLRSYSSPLSGQDHEPNWFTMLLGNISDTIVPAHLREPQQYFLWQRDPWETGDDPDREGLAEATGIDFLLPYWMGRYKGFIRAE